MSTTEKLQNNEIIKIIAEQQVDFAPTDKLYFKKYFAPSLREFLKSFSSEDMSYNNVLTAEAMVRFTKILFQNLSKGKFTKREKVNIIGVFGHLQVREIHKIDEDDSLLADEKITLLESLKENFIKMAEVLGCSPSEFGAGFYVINRLLKKNKGYQKSLDEIEEELDKEILLENYYYCDNFDADKLQHLHDQLVMANFMDENKFFIETFKKRIPDPNLRSRWSKNGCRQLIYLVFLILKGGKYENESIHKIIPRLFVNSDGEEFLNDTLKTEYNAISGTFKNSLHLSPHLIKILGLFENIS